MNHQERMELLGALSRSGVSYFKSHDLEVQFRSDKPEVRGLEAWMPNNPIKFGSRDPSAGSAHVGLTEQDTGHNPAAASNPIQNDDATKKLTDLIETLKMDDASLLDKIFPAGAGL